MAKASDQLEKLIRMRTGYEYTPKTAEQIKKQAEGEYQSYYDQLRLAARQAQQATDLRLQQQISGLQDTYDKQREDSARQFRQAYSQADRQLLGRGMQRSSYGASALANVALEGNRAQQKINDAQAAAASQIEDQRSQLQTQLNEKLGQYTASQAADVLNRQRQLEDTEYQRRVDALKSQTSLEQAIYSAMYQQERDAQQDSQWQQSFDAQQNQWNREFNAEQDRFNRQFEYQQSRDTVADQQWQKQFDYQQGRDTVADRQWQQQFAETQRQSNINQSNWEKQFAESQRQFQVSQEQWQKQFDESQRQFNENFGLESFRYGYNQPQAEGGGGGGDSYSSGGGNNPSKPQNKNDTLLDYANAPSANGSNVKTGTLSSNAPTVSYTAKKDTVKKSTATATASKTGSNSVSSNLSKASAYVKSKKK